MNFDRSTRSSNFIKSIEFTIPWETGRDKKGNIKEDGGLHFLDGGEATKWGIHKKSNPEVDVENLTLDQAIEVYHAKYWLFYLLQPKVSFDLDNMEIGAAVSLFDAGVNCGQPRAYQWGKKAANAKDFAKVVNGLREAYYFDLKTSNFPKHGKNFNGWMSRLNDLKKYVEILRIT